jgi:O-antigen/teichoic acid export membrane protein
VLGNVLLSIWFFRAHPELSPSISLNKRYVRPLLSIGLQFFVIQLAVLIIFTTDKMLITQLFGPSHVTQYEVVFKLFSALTFAHALISAPLWSAYTDAFQRSDLEWINKMLHKQLLIFLVIISAAALLVTTAESVIKIWVGDDINVTFGLIVAMALFILVSIWNNIFATIVNGIGEIKIQLYTALVALIINIPLSVILAKQYGLGLSGIVAGTVLSLSLAAVALPIQVIRLSEKSA